MSNTSEGFLLNNIEGLTKEEQELALTGFDSEMLITEIRRRLDVAESTLKAIRNAMIDDKHS